MLLYAKHFCSGAKAKYRVMELSGIKAGVQSYVYQSQKPDIQRVKKAEKRPSELFKRKRRATERVAVRIEEARFQGEGTTYEAGAF